MRKSISRLFVGAAIVSGLALAAGNAVAANTPVTFQLNWVAGGANAGFAAAVAEGFYRDVGLDVTLVQGNGSGNTAQLVANGRSEIAYADAVAVSQLIAKGAPMKVLSTVYQSNPNEVSALKKTGIKSIKDLAGKKVGVPSGSSQTTMLPLFLKANGLKESEVNLINMPLTSMVPTLLQGQVDAMREDTADSHLGRMMDSSITSSQPKGGPNGVPYQRVVSARQLLSRITRGCLGLRFVC